MALWERRDRAYDNEVAHSPKESGTGDRRRERERERKEVSTEGATWSYKGGERERSAYARVSGKEKRKERKGQRRATGMPTTTSMGEGKATKRDDFFRILRTDHPSPPLPNAERNNSPRGGRGLKSAATESPIIFRSLSFPPNQRIKASLRGPASTSPPRVPRSFNEGRRRREDVGWTTKSLSLPWIPFFSLAGSWIVSILRGRGIEERRKPPRGFLRVKSRVGWWPLSNGRDLSVAFQFPFDSPLGDGVFDGFGEENRESLACVKEINRSIDFSRFSCC